MRQAEESKRRERVIQAAVVLLIIGGLIAFSQLAPDISLQSTLNDVAKKVGKWTYLLVGISAFIETAAFVGLVLPGRDRRDPRRGCRGAGRDVGHSHHRDRLGLRGRRRLGQLPARQAARTRLRHASRAEGADHARALRPGRGLLLSPRGEDDPGRALHRAGAGARPVRGRELGDALHRVPAVQRPRHGAVGGRVRAARVLRLAAASTPPPTRPGRARCSSASRSS